MAFPKSIPSLSRCPHCPVRSSSLFLECPHQSPRKTSVPCHNSETVRDYEISNASRFDSMLIQNLLRDAQAKLVHLQAQKERICSRMQALRYLCTHARGTNLRSEAQCHSTSRKLTLSDTAPESAKTAQHRQYYVDIRKLRRACRIALLESGEPQSSADIYERIQKRGSMSFDERENVPRILTAQLKSMAASAEILCTMVNGEMRWQSKVPKEDLP